MKETFWGHFKIAGHSVTILSQNLMIKKKNETQVSNSDSKL